MAVQEISPDTIRPRREALELDTPLGGMTVDWPMELQVLLVMGLLGLAFMFVYGKYIKR